MNICIVTHKLLKGDGQARVNYEIVKELLDQNYHVTVFASGVAPELLEKPGIHWIKVPVSGWPTQLLKNHVFATISSLLLLKHRSKFDLVMVNGFITWARSDINAVHFVHSSWIKSSVHPSRLNKNMSGFYQFLFTYSNSILEKLAFSRAKIIVPVSEKVKKELEEINPALDLRVIMNGVDIEEFYPDKNKSRSELDLPGNVPLALFAGDIKSPRKNLDSVLKALCDVKNLHLAVAGATQGSPYIKMAEQLGLEGRVHFLGFRKDIAQLMKCVDFFVFPSRYEACTLVVIEALASGLPVITTYQSGVSELIESDRKAGVVLGNSEDVAGLRNAMNLLCGDEELRKQMGANARIIAERQSWRSVAAKYIDLFKEVAKSPEKAIVVPSYIRQGAVGNENE
ncbi:glycosyltransferase family 4 protein [Paenibacillus hamazuiensis]|uniref:glycosyltransferase family 4 protein n=1 Tax=Paenibacillus hamazuiensis TaxID=2936508 RepID=UPI00200FFEFF|nr:glycosyltransferase family 4 protein [Paenibacillus hamazuiensis]